MCTWKSYRQAELKREIVMILVALLFSHTYLGLILLWVSPPIYSCIQASNLIWMGTTTAFWGGFLSFLRRKSWIMRLKTMETSSQNYNPSSTTGTTPCITYKHNFSNFQKLLCLPFLNDVHHKLNLVEKETVGKTRHEVSVPYCYLYCKEVAECLDTIFFFFSWI